MQLCSSDLSACLFRVRVLVLPAQKLSEGERVELLRLHLLHLLICTHRRAGAVTEAHMATADPLPPRHSPSVMIRVLPPLWLDMSDSQTGVQTDTWLAPPPDFRSRIDHNYRSASESPLRDQTKPGNTSGRLPVHVIHIPTYHWLEPLRDVREKNSPQGSACPARSRSRNRSTRRGSWTRRDPDAGSGSAECRAR